MKRAPKRYEYHVTYDAPSEWWVCKVGGAIADRSRNREDFIRYWARELTEYERENGQHSELIIHRKDGTIGKGSSSRRTYGGDDPKSKG